MTPLVAALAAGLLVAVSAVAQHFNTVFSKGPGFVLTDRSESLSPSGFAGRASRTLQNNLESAGMVVPLVLVIAVLGVQGPIPALAASVYAAARVGFTLAYWANISLLRSIFWAIGMLMIAILGVFAVEAILLA